MPERPIFIPTGATATQRPPTRPETRNQRFRLRAKQVSPALAEKRVQKALERLDQLGHLASSNYECSHEEAGQILATLQAKLDELGHRFNRRTAPRTTFAFSPENANAE